MAAQENIIRVGRVVFDLLTPLGTGMAETAQALVAGDMSAPVTAAGRELLDRLCKYDARIRAEAEHNDHAGVLATDVFTGFAEDGILGATVPVELGGLGVSQLHDVAVALKQLAEADPSTALALHVQFSRGLTLTYEWRHGGPDARRLAQRLLCSMATGEALVCGAVKDAPGVVTELTPDPETGGWLLSGRKTLVSMAPIGTHFFVHAQQRLDGEAARLVVPLVSRNTPGFTVLDSAAGLGMRASGTVDIVFDQCRVPADEILGRESGTVGAGNDAVLAGQTVSSICMLGIYVGAAQAARDLAIGIAARKTEPAAAVRTLVTDIDARLYALKATAGAALTNADAYNADIDIDPAVRGRSMMTPFQCAKLMVNRLAGDIVNDCLTVVGGAVYGSSHPLGRLYRDVRAGWFMQPYTYVDGVEFLSGQALGINRDNDYVSVRAKQTSPQP